MDIYKPAAAAFLVLLGLRLYARDKPKKQEPPKGLNNSSGLLGQKKQRRHSTSQASNPQLKEYKQLYHQLHNLESNPSVVSEARDALLSLLSDTLAAAKANATDDSVADAGILAMDTFDPEALARFLRKEEEAVSTRLEEYVRQRKAGAPRELFQTAEDAKAWLVSRAPSKLVDGAWLGHVHRMSTPFELRHITKSAWQIFSEELGDGDITKNHAAIYRELLRHVAPGLPEADSADFLACEGMDDVATWRSAVTQLLISLFPHEFMAEMVGFNLHFECLTWDTMRAALELRELGLDSYYFLLHISIDNSDSGHAKMALQVVVDYLQHVRDTHGEAALQRAWRGVQAGYLLSASAVLESARTDTLAQTTTVDKLVVRNRFAPEMVSIFQAKASVAAKLHCASAARIGKKKLSQWLEHGVLGMDFLDELAQARPWIRPGDSECSRFVTELRWNGKMFGAFTDSELSVLCNWIDALLEAPTKDPSVYWAFVCRQPTPIDNMDVRTTPAVFHSRGLSTPWKRYDGDDGMRKPLPLIASVAAAEKLISLWFAHASLLEGIVSIPIHTCDDLGSAVVRILRAQRGFAAETDGVAGMDEMRQADSVGLVELGLEMARSARLLRPDSLLDVVPLATDSADANATSEFAMDMLHWSMRPVRHRSALLGMAWAFTGLHDHLAEHDCGLLSRQAREVLGQMATREHQALAICRKELSANPNQVRDFDAAAAYAYGKIAQCLA